MIRQFYEEMPKFLKAIVLFLVLWAGFVYAQPLPLSLYVNNQPYPKPVFSNKNILYVSVDDALPFLGMKVIRKGRMLCGVSSGYQGPVCPESESPALLYINGTPILQGVLVHREHPWISIAVLAKTLGYTYQYNRETGIADLTNQALVNLAAALPDLAPPKSEKKNGSKEKEPISGEVQAPDSDIYSTQNPTTYEIRTNFSVVNTSDRAVKGVTATLVYLDGYGKPLVSHSFNIGTMEPHATVKQEDYWINYTSVSNPKATVELDWEGKKKE